MKENKVKINEDDYGIVYGVKVNLKEFAKEIIYALDSEDMDNNIGVYHLSDGTEFIADPGHLCGFISPIVDKLEKDQNGKL